MGRRCRVKEAKSERGVGEGGLRKKRAMTIYCTPAAARTKTEHSNSSSSYSHLWPNDLCASLQVQNALSESSPCFQAQPCTSPVPKGSCKCVTRPSRHSHFPSSGAFLSGAVFRLFALSSLCLFVPLGCPLLADIPPRASWDISASFGDNHFSLLCQSLFLEFFS